MKLKWNKNGTQSSSKTVSVPPSDIPLNLGMMFFVSLASLWLLHLLDFPVFTRFICTRFRIRNENDGSTNLDSSRFTSKDVTRHYVKRVWCIQRKREKKRAEQSFDSNGDDDDAWQKLPIVSFVPRSHTKYPFATVTEEIIRNFESVNRR